MNGIELIKRTSIDKDLASNEAPPLFTAFARTYELGRNALKVKQFLYQEELILFSNVLYKEPNGSYENAFSHFFDFEEINKELKLYKNKYDDYHKHGFIKIGLFEINDSILIGKEESNLDEIWKLNGDWGEEKPYMEKLASNIFEFVNSFEESIINMNLIVRHVDTKYLYQNWGEDFWRVRYKT